MSEFLWEDENPFSNVRVKMEPLDDIDGGFPGDISTFGGCIFQSPIKSEPKWLEINDKAENTSFDSGYTSPTQDNSNLGVSIDPDFVREKPQTKFTGHTNNKVFAKIERGGRVSGFNAQHWSPIKSEGDDKFSAFMLENDFLLEPKTHDISSEASFEDDMEIYHVAEPTPTKTKRKYTRRKPLKKKLPKHIKLEIQDHKPSKRLNTARNQFTAALMNADQVSKLRHQKHTENLEMIKVTREQTAKAAKLLNRPSDSRKVHRVIFQGNQKLQGDRFTWSFGDSINRSFKHISVKRGVKRKHGMFAAEARRLAFANDSESD